MKAFFTLLLIATAFGVSAQKVDKRYFELRIYYTAPGRMDATAARTSPLGDP